MGMSGSDRLRRRGSERTEEAGAVCILRMTKRSPESTAG